MFQGIQAVAMPLAQEFGFTREIEDRVQAPCPIWLVAISKVLSGGAQGLLSAIVVLPIASVIHASGVEADINLHWLLIVTLVPLSCLAMTSLGLLLGTSFEPRNLGLMFGFIVLPITFLGGTYYQWTRLAPVKAGGFHWLQIIVLINPLIYVNDGMRAALTNASHMHLYVIHPALVAFSVIFMTLGLRNFPPQSTLLIHSPTIRTPHPVTRWLSEPGQSRAGVDGPGVALGGVMKRYSRIDPPKVPTGQYARSQLSPSSRRALVRSVADAATHPEMWVGATPIRGRAPGMSAFVMPRGPK